VNADRAAELLDALPDGERALWATAFHAGLRIGELRALRFRDVEFDTGVIHVRAGWDDVEGEQATKTSAGERMIPMVGRLRAELARHRLAQGAGDKRAVLRPFGVEPVHAIDR
jgi:integrase